MGTFSLYGRHWLVGGALTPEALPALSTVWFALTTTEPAESDDGADIDEPTIASYGRIQYPLNATAWTSSGYGTFLNTQEISWPDVSEPWPVIIGWAMLTAQTDGNTLAVGRLRVPLEPFDGDALSIPPYAVSLSALGQVG